MRKDISLADKSGKVSVGDIDWKADLFWATQDLYQIEKHLYYTIGMVKEGKDSIWCIAKHLLGACGQGFEVVSKLFFIGEEDLAKKFVDDCMLLHDIFWGLKGLSQKDEETRFKVYSKILTQIRLVRARWLKILKGEKDEV